MEDSMTLGQQLAEARKAKKIRQHAVASELGVTVQAVSQWERDKTIPSPLNLVRLSAFLGVELQGSIPLKDLPSLNRPSLAAPLIKPFATLFYKEGRDELDDEFADMGGWDMRQVPIDWIPEGNVFAMLIEDRSMAPMFIPDDMIIVDTGLKAEPGDIVVGQEFPSRGGLVRKFQLRGVDEAGRTIAQLTPLNPDFPTITITDGGTGEVTGCVVEFRRILKRKP